MIIKRVELENIKSHSNSTFEFEPGSTAIYGDNGAGKSTIIEAIAWSLFDVLAYKKDEFLKRGTKKGSVRVTFISGLDEREYLVYRDTGAGYYIYDPALKLRVADKKDEVTRFLSQHLGVERGTDLETLFNHAIGVPQGMFTAVFLATAAERKRTFDILLKVEEYRRSADELLRTQRYVEQQANVVANRIARAQGEIEGLESVRVDLEQVTKELHDLSAKLAAADRDAEEAAAAVRELDIREKSILEVTREVEKLRSESLRAELVKTQRETEFAQAVAAADLVASVIADAERHAEALGRIKELERERQARQSLRDQLVRVETAASRVRHDCDVIRRDIQKAADARTLVETLRPLAAEQVKLEEERERVRERLSLARLADEKAKGLQDQLAKMRLRWQGIKDQKAALEAKASAVNGDAARSRETEIVRELARLNAALERDQAFQKEISNGLCPILSARCLNLKEGETLETFVVSQFAELRSQIDVLEVEHVSIAEQLARSQEAENARITLPSLKAQMDEIEQEGQSLKSDIAAHLREAEQLSELTMKFAGIEVSIKQLDDPKARITVIEGELAREADLTVKAVDAERNLERLESERRQLVESMESYTDLDEQWSAVIAVRDSTADAFRSKLANEALAATAAERELVLAEATQAHRAATEQSLEAQKALEAASSGYDRDRHNEQRQRLSDAEKLQVEIRTRIAVSQARVTELTARVEKLETIQRSMFAELREKERYEKVYETLDFIRSTLKDAAPLVARTYVWRVSQEASVLYREITGNAERTLKWSDEYAISLEEGGYDRPFVSLSGGEQMAAALSVRLALLKQFSDVRIAFFDEPTMNLDSDRRENLAQQIAKIGHFDQLFVISHDDTFESYMDHEIKVEREAAAAQQ